MIITLSNHMSMTSTWIGPSSNLPKPLIQETQFTTTFTADFINTQWIGRLATRMLVSKVPSKSTVTHSSRPSLKMKLNPVKVVTSAGRGSIATVPALANITIGANLGFTRSWHGIGSSNSWPMKENGLGILMSFFFPPSSLLCSARTRITC